MNNELICFCPKCKTMFAVSKRNGNPVCPDCKGQLVNTNLSYEEYSSMTDSEKESFENRYYRNNPQESHKKQRTANKNKDSDVWISLLEAFCAIVIALCILFALFVLGQNIKAGIVVAIVLTLIGFLLVSGIMVFVGMARDLRAIRNEIENNKDR